MIEQNAYSATWHAVFGTRPEEATAREVAFLARVLPSGSVLDVCCGTGRHLAGLAALGHTVTGVEREPAVARAAREAVPATRYGDNAPMAAVCCNVCRTCTTTNLLALAVGAGAGAVYGVARFAKRTAARI